MCPNLPARILSAIPEYYSTFQEAYDNAFDGDIIQLHDIIFSGDFFLDLSKSITVTGGWDCDYAVVTGSSRFNGTMFIDSGTAAIDNIVLE